MKISRLYGKYDGIHFILSDLKSDFPTVLTET